LVLVLVWAIDPSNQTELNFGNTTSCATETATKVTIKHRVNTASDLIPKLHSLACSPSTSKTKSAYSTKQHSDRNQSYATATATRATTNTQPAHNIRPFNSFPLPDSRTSYAHIPITFALASSFASAGTTCTASPNGEPDLYHAYAH
jgi:hypothetical protein